MKMTKKKSSSLESIFLFLTLFFLLEKRSPHFSLSLSLSLLIRVFLFRRGRRLTTKRRLFREKRDHFFVVVVSWCEIQKECTHSTTRWVLLLTTFGDTNSKFRITTTRLFARRSFESWRREREEGGKEDDKKNARTASTQRIIVNFF